jgi:hypothetical protein
MLRPLITLSILTTTATPGRADPGVAAHALVVGSNAAGPGQTELRYAEDDARRVGSLLTELGGYAATSVDIVTRPTPAVLRDRLAKLTTRVQADLAAGKHARVFFYYSGHARATAIDLGPEPLPLAELRQRLFAVGATLTVVVLDACQSGAFSRVKGAEPAADFSYNSRQQLDAKGVAVLASSTGSELSQESEQLRSSYFTHHLIVGMRGAGDANGDGQVTVDEAYRYAYHQTLLATAVTAVGGQHVTLEVDLKGHGEVALSYPRKATARIDLPAQLEGKALVQLKKTRTIVAETHKAKGKVVRIAVAPGDYEVLVRQGNRMLRCPAVAPGVVDLARCSNEAYVDGTRKGGSFVPRWRVAFGMSVGSEGDSAFTDTLRNFGYREDNGAASNLSLSIAKEVVPHVFVGGMIERQGGPSFIRDTELAPLRFGWSTTFVGGTVAARYPLTRWLFAYGDGRLGLGIGRTRFVDQMDEVTNETHFGVGLVLEAGLGVDRLYGTSVAFKFLGRYGVGSVIENDIGDTHNAMGMMLGIGLEYVRGGSR